MLLEQTHFPIANNPEFPWATVIITVVLIGSVGYLSYLATKPSLNISQPQKNKTT